MKTERNNSLFLHEVDIWVFCWLILARRRMYRNIYCTSVSINERLFNILHSRFNIEIVDDYEKCPTSTSLQFEKDYVVYVEELFQDASFKKGLIPVLKQFDIKTDCLMNFLKKYIVNTMFSSASMVWRSRYNEVVNSRVDVLVSEKKIFTQMAGANQKIIELFNPRKAIINWLKFFFNLWRCLKPFFQIAKTKITALRSGTRYKIVFEQMYGTMDNPDFKAFYNYFKQRDDVLYLCPDRKCEIYQFLKQENKPVIAPSELSLSVDFKKQFMVFGRLFFSALLSKTYFSEYLILTSVLRIYYFQLFYECLFERVKPLFYLHTSSAYIAYHPLMTAACNKYNVKHIGYMHSQFTYLRAIFAFIDFHYFGLLGRRFRDSYVEYWPDDIQYEILGPQCLEASDEKTIFNDKDLFTVGVMSRPIKEQLGGYSYTKFITRIWTVLHELKIPNLHVIFKESMRKEWAESIKESLNNSMPISFESAYHHDYQGKRTYVGEVMTCSDIVIVSSIGTSTTAFEAIGKRKKVVVLLPTGQSPHPFEEYSLPLVAKSQDELKNALQWMMKTPQDEYESLIQPVIDDWSKISNGRLVEDFFLNIENDSLAN